MVFKPIGTPEEGLVKKRFSDILFAVGIFAIFPAFPAHAYLDGATVSIVLQAIVGAFASILVFGKMYWSRLVNFFKRSGDNTPE